MGRKPSQKTGANTGCCYQMVPHLAGEGLGPWAGNCQKKQEAAS